MLYQPTAQSVIKKKHGFNGGHGIRKCFKFIDHEFKMVQVHQDSREEGTTKPIHPQETEKIRHGVLTSSKSSTAAPSRASCLTGCLTAWYGNCSATTEGSAYGPAHHRGQASCHPGPLYQVVSEEGPKNCQRVQPL